MDRAKGLPEAYDMKIQSKHISPLLLLFAAVVWGFAFAAQKGAGELYPLHISAIRYGVGALFLFPLIPLFDKITANGRHFLSKKGKTFTKAEWIGGAVCGCALFTASNLQQLGISGATAGATSFITALYVIFVPIFSLFIGKKYAKHVWIGILLAMGGFYLLCVQSDFSVDRYSLIVLASSMLFAIHIIFIGHFSKTCEGVRLSCLQFFFVAVFSAIASLFFGRERFSPSLILDNVWQLLYLGVISCGVGYTFQTLGQKDTPPALASILMSLEAVFGAFGAAIFLGERMSAREYAGSAVVLIGVLIAQVDPLALIRKAGKKKALPEAGSDGAGQDSENPS